MKKILMILLIVLLSASCVSAKYIFDDYDFIDTYSIQNVTNVTANDFFGNIAWGYVTGAPSFTDTIWSITGYLYNNSGSLDVNETRLNNTIDSIVLTNNNSMKGYVDAQDSAQDACSEITGCVENAVTNSSSVSFLSILSLDWTNVTITESQISDLSHTVDTDTWWSILTTDFINNSNVLELNWTTLNATMDARDADTTYSALSEFTNDVGYVTNATMNKTVAWGDVVGEPTFLEDVVDDTSPQLGGYLDTNGQTIGSASDEIEAVYVADDTAVYYGNSQSAYVMYNTTLSSLVIKVN